MPAANHVLLTRFNLPSAGVERLIRAQEGWLRARVELFRRYCVPSVRAQTCGDSDWIVYFDPESPDWIRAMITSDQQSGLYQPMFRSSVSADELLADIRSVVGVPCSRLITTNLDNDDGLAIDFVQRVRDADPGNGRGVIYLTKGLIKSDSGVFLHEDRHNAFCSVAEGWESPSTCWSNWHNLLSTTMPVVEVRGDEPAWLQVVHGTNVSNRIHGKRTVTGRFAKLFPGLLDDVQEPSRSQLTVDRLVLQPSRTAKDAVRSTVKAIAMKVAGKRGLDKLKLTLADRSTRK